MSAPAPNPSSAWWSQTRAALARVFGHVQVRQLEMEDAPAAAGGARSDALDWPAPARGMREAAWEPQSMTQVWQPPSAPAGGGGVDASAVPCVVAGNAVPHLASDTVHDGKIGALTALVRAVNMEPGASGGATVQALPVLLGGGRACPLSVALPAPPVRAASLALGGLPRAGARREGRGGVPAFAAPRTWSRLDRVTRVPIPRRRAAVPAGMDAAQAFETERRALAASCWAGLDDVKLLAVFPHVPLSLVQHMAVTPGGDVLRLWLRPEALASGAGWTAMQVTIVLGRRRATGEAIRAVLPEAALPGRKQ